MGRSKPKQEVTEYRMSEHFGICTGPVDYISEIIINEKTAWTGRRVDNGEILINKPSLFGGVKKEGGAVGTATFLSGGPTQTIPERLAAKVALTTATMPAYRGMASLWFTENEGASYPGFYWTANSPYLPGVWVKVSRASTGLSETKARIYRDLNGPISIYFLLDRSNSLSSGEFAAIKSAANAGLDLLEEAIEDLEVRVDIGVRFYSAGSTAIERTNCDASDIADIRAFIASAGQVTGGDVEAAMEFVEDWFTASLATSFSRRAVIFVTDSNTEDNMTAAAAGPAADMLDRDSGAFNLTDGTSVDMYAINYVSTNTTWTSLLDNTPQDGVPVISSTDESGLTNAVADAVRSFDFDSNPAHIIYDCLTSSDWGMGAPVSAIDVDSFEAAADMLFDERFGLSMIWTQQSTIEAFLAEIVDHIEATLFVSPRNGKLTLKLIRDDYSVTGLPEFTPDNSVVTNFSRKLWGETVNEIVVTFTNPDNEEEETVIAQDLANISSQGGIVSDGRNYYGVRTRALATELAHRDLRAASTPLASCDIEVNREAWDLLPGDVVILNSPDDGVEQIVMRVGPVDYGKPGDSVIKAQLVEDVFSLPLADYTVPPKTEAEPTSEDPSPADDTLIFTLPYYLAVQESSELLASAAYPEVIAGVLASEDGSDTSDFELYGEGVDAAGNAIVESLGTKTIASRGTLQAEIDAEVETLFVSFPDRTQGNGPEVGGLMLIEGTDETDSELCLISAFGGSPTAYTMKRGVLDTTPKDWPAGTPVWFVDTAMVFTDPTVRSEAETVDYQVLINTSIGQLELDDAPIVSETLTARPWLPLRPADVKVEGVGFGAVDISDYVNDSPAPTFTVTWARRDREFEDELILAWDAADVTPEAGQTTTITIMDADRNVLEVHSGISGTSYEVPLSSFYDGSPATPVESAIVRVTSEKDGLESLQGHEITVVLAALTISGTPVLTATEGSSYGGFTVSASYGTPPYSYSLVGDWPAGISVDSSTGVVSGTPTEVGSFTGLSVRVTDDVSDTDDLPSFTLEVADGSTYYAELTIGAGEVSSDLTDFPVYVDLSDMPAGFWSHTREDGGDIRVKTTGGTTIPFDLVWFDQAKQDGVLYFKRSVAAGSSTVVRIHYGDSTLNLLPYNDSNGRNAVWSDYDVVIIPGDSVHNRTGKSAARTWNYPQTFDLISTSGTIVGHEGVIPLPDGTFVCIASNGLRKYNSALNTVLATNSDPAGDTGTGATDCGGGCYYDGKLYVTVGAPQQIAVFDASDLSFIESFDISETGSGVGGLEVCPLDGHIYAIPYVAAPSSSTSLLKYNRETGAHIATITMSAGIEEAQGIIWYRDAFLVPNDEYDRYYRVELNGTVEVGGLFGTSSTIVEDGGEKGGDVYVMRTLSADNAVVERWSAVRSALGGGGAKFTSDARITAPVTSPGTTWSIGVSLARSDTTTRVALALTTDTANVGNVTYASGTIRPFFDATNGALAYGSAKNPSAGTMARVNVVYQGSTERRAFYNGGDKVTDTTVTAIGSTFTKLVYGSDRYDTQSFSWRGTVGFAYLRMSALSDAWIAAEFSNLNAPASFYSIGSEVAV